jgi:hypothetical protein
MKEAMNPATYPTVAALYEGDQEGLIEDAIGVRNRFVRQFKYPPTHKDIARNLEKLHAERVESYLARRQKDESEASQAAQSKPANGTKRLQAKKGAEVASGDVDYEKMTDEQLARLAAKRAAEAIKEYEKSQG